MAATERTCTWPACLTDAEADQLAQDVVNSALGIPTSFMPDKRLECRCVDPGPIDWELPECMGDE